MSNHALRSSDQALCGCSGLSLCLLYVPDRYIPAPKLLVAFGSAPEYLLCGLVMFSHSPSVVWIPTMKSQHLLFDIKASPFENEHNEQIMTSLCVYTGKREGKL